MGPSLCRLLRPTRMPRPIVGALRGEMGGVVSKTVNIETSCHRSE